MFKILVVKKEKQKEKNKVSEKIQKKENPVLDDLFFILGFSVLILKFPFELVYYTIKKQPLLPFKKLVQYIKSHLIDKHKEVFVLLFLNTLVFISFYFIVFFSAFVGLSDDVFNNIIDIWELIFTSNPSNFYLFNLSFLAHMEISHFLYNMLFLYFFGILVNYRFNVLKLYFLFGFVLNIIHFLIHYLLFFDPSYSAIGASGIIFAFAAISLVFFPLSISLVPTLIFLLVQEFPYLPLFEIFAIQEEFSSLFSNDSIDHLAHILGFGLGLIFSYFYLNKLSKLKRIWLFLITAVYLLLVVIVFLFKN